MSKRMRRGLLAGVLLALTICTLVISAAAENNCLYLYAQTSSKVIIAPQRVYFTGTPSVKEVLAQSGHDFSGLESGSVSAIDGVVGNFTRSDELGGYELDVPARPGQIFCFTEKENSCPSEALSYLVRQLADYQSEPEDVRLAAKEAYEKAGKGFLNVPDDQAEDLADELKQAISEYRESLNGARFTVRFNGYETGASLSVRNIYGKVYTGQENYLELPDGSYSFELRKDVRQTEGSFTVSGSDVQIEAQLPTEESWLDKDALRVSKNGYSETLFSAGVLPIVYDDQRNCCVCMVPDTYSGQLFLYAKTTGTEPQGMVTRMTVIYHEATVDSSAPEVQKQIAMQSYSQSVNHVLEPGCEGNTLTLRLYREAEGLRYSQDHLLQLERMPSLRGLSLKDEKGNCWPSVESFEEGRTEYNFDLPDSISRVTICPAVLEDGSYTVTANGQPLADGQISLERQTLENGTVVLEVSSKGCSTTYTLHFRSLSGVTYIFNVKGGGKMLLRDENGAVVPTSTAPFLTQNNSRYTYCLSRGRTYRYLVTSGTDPNCHLEETVQPNGTATQITVNVEAFSAPTLNGVSFGLAATALSGELLTPSFQSNVSRYSLCVMDYLSAFYVKPEADAGIELFAVYQKTKTQDDDGETKQAELANQKSAELTNFLLYQSGWGNTLTLRAAQTANGAKRYRDYEFTVERQLTLKNLALRSGDETLVLRREDEQRGFASACFAYSVTVPMAAESLRVLPELYNSAPRYGYQDNGYRVSVNGQEAGAQGMEIKLSGASEQETVTVTVSNTYGGLEGVYTITVRKAAPISAAVHLGEEQGNLAVYERVSQRRVWPQDGMLALSAGFTYDYSYTKNGYIGINGAIQISENGTVAFNQEVLRPGENGYVLDFSLQKAPMNTSLHSVAAQWADFRGTQYTKNDEIQGTALTNNGVVSAKTPIYADGGALYWAVKEGEGYSSEAVGSPILVDGNLITYAGNQIMKIDSKTGKNLLCKPMDHSSSFAITPPTYYQGMIFVALSDGTVQAFDADTLESLWVYRDPLKGQPNCPITVYDGYLYTGFWTKETDNANFVCLSVCDERPEEKKEEKIASWRYTQKGGFYWAGAYVCGNYLLVGTDDGEVEGTYGKSSLLLLDPKSGAKLDSWDGLNGDVRSTVSYDLQTDAFYFTSKGGSFYSVQVKQEDGQWKLVNQKQLSLDNGSEKAPMSTCTPVVWNGRAYIGVSGAAQFGQYSGHNITVIDIENWRIAYHVPTQGYPQTSGLLTTAYSAENGGVYVYFFDNYTPGKLKLLRDRPGQTEPEYLTQETYTAAGKEVTVSTAYTLFTPVGEQAQYAICSPIVDEYGTIYFKNDSAYLMAYGSMVQKLEITRQPDKTAYAPGEDFDPTGMVVTATFANGLTRDVTTELVCGSITADSTQVTLAYPYLMYQNREEGNAMVSGATCATPTVTVPITVALPQDAVATVKMNADRTVTIQVNQTMKTNLLFAACYDQNGRMLRVWQKTVGEETITLDSPPTEGTEIRLMLTDTNCQPVVKAFRETIQNLSTERIWTEAE